MANSAIAILVISALLSASCEGRFKIRKNQKETIEATPALADEVDTGPTISVKFISLTSVEVDDSKISMSWVAASDDKTTANRLVYEIYQSTSANLIDVDSTKSNGAKIASLTGSTEFQITNIAIDKNYYFNVLVRDEENKEKVYKLAHFCGPVLAHVSERLTL